MQARQVPGTIYNFYNFYNWNIRRHMESVNHVLLNYSRFSSPLDYQNHLGLISFRLVQVKYLFHLYLQRLEHIKMQRFKIATLFILSSASHRPGGAILRSKAKPAHIFTVGGPLNLASSSQHHWLLLPPPAPLPYFSPAASINLTSTVHTQSNLHSPSFSFNILSLSYCFSVSL
ncbi:hypothetical protein BT63DRAFT_450024 [Microthyrium microscopicum]|uniref:Uncharacterized protein n=1 Tax=Microthyrium microscopicum TaxID=703497 RepID=A0A6A6UVD1_9PEZI|nr:hypothetical protein BT63DRAFT_450024 [Microthyrium microscopicum]